MNRPIPPYAANVSLDDDRYSNNDERRTNKHPTRFVQHKLKSAETCTLLWGNRSINDIHEFSMTSSSRRTMLVRKSLSPSCLRKKKPSPPITNTSASDESDDGCCSASSFLLLLSNGTKYQGLNVKMTLMPHGTIGMNIWKSKRRYSKLQS